MDAPSSKEYTYCTNQASRDQIVALLQACDTSFIPPLSSRVDLDSYATKLFNHARLLEAWIQDDYVGVVAVYLNDARTRRGFISNVCVRPEHGGKGIASQLIARCKERAIRDGFDTLELEVSPTNLPAVALYQKSGFLKVKESEDCAVMVCRLLQEESPK
jgi:ribosomal protein S18 acetylase RimI-like enzyme